ncbi:MAG: MetQ/NlpA family ABC transporter substrate-binding protein [Firmicutes bacterium]|nr:MetQ/NlpA family ABC transporter substrate-binding protein [Bacillota bacterium]
MKRILTVILIALLLVPTTFALVGCDRYDYTVTASVTPHAIILRQVQPILREQGFRFRIAEQGWELQNDVVRDGDAIANFFQHRPFLDNWNADNSGADLVPVFGTHFEPLNIIPGGRANSDSLQEIIAQASTATPANRRLIIPADATNGLRALELLEYHNVVTFVGGNAPRTNNVAHWDSYFEIYPIAAGALVGARPDALLSVINGNWAVQGNILDYRIEFETPEQGAEFTNFIVVREENRNHPFVVALVNALNTTQIRSFISNHDAFGGALTSHPINLLN